MAYRPEPMPKETSMTIVQQTHDESTGAVASLARKLVAAGAIEQYRTDRDGEFWVEVTLLQPKMIDRRE